MTDVEKNSIIDFLKDDDSKSLHIAMIALEELTNLFKEHGYEEQEIDTNGWQVDFWHEHSKEGSPTIQVSGSLFYGNFQLTKL